MIFPFLHPATKSKVKEEGKHSLITLQEAEHNNTMEGSEFLDDAIRTVDQPLKDTREDTTATSAEILS